MSQEPIEVLLVGGEHDRKIIPNPKSDEIAFTRKVKVVDGEKDRTYFYRYVRNKLRIDQFDFAEEGWRVDKDADEENTQPIRHVNAQIFSVWVPKTREPNELELRLSFLTIEAAREFAAYWVNAVITQSQVIK